MKKHDNNIADLRRKAGFTQKELAEMLNITDKAVSKWERGLSLPDITLLPKLSLLLGADIPLLLGKSRNHCHEGWMGVIDFRSCEVDLRQNIYDKPLVYFLLVHFLLLDIKEVCFLCSKENEEYLKQGHFDVFGFTFTFCFEDCTNHNLMILNGPHFLFGSELTRRFQGAMISETLTAIVQKYAPAPVLFCPAEYSPVYGKNPAYLYEIAVPRTLGRGIVCLEMRDADTLVDVGAFVKMYQNKSGLPIGSLEEIAYKKKIISKEKFLEIAEKVPYGDLLEMLVSSSESKLSGNQFVKSKPTIG